MIGIFDKLTGRLVACSYFTSTKGHVQFYDFTQNTFKRVSVEHFYNRYELRAVKQVKIKKGVWQ